MDRLILQPLLGEAISGRACYRNLLANLKAISEVTQNKQGQLVPTPQSLSVVPGLRSYERRYKIGFHFEMKEPIKIVSAHFHFAEANLAQEIY
ncbi:MAG: hypothetical protein ACK521_06820 [bacterium]